MVKLFVGFEFGSNSVLARKVTGFRKRFDPKFNQYSFAHMALLAPFESLDFQKKEIIETLKEEFETFFYGQGSTPMLGFKGLGVYNNRKKKILYLNPYIDSDLKYCMEIVQEVCLANLSPGYKYQANVRQFLPLGFFNKVTELDLVMEQAQIEFRDYGEISIDSIALFEKKQNSWQKIETLIDFELKDSPFLHPKETAI